MQAITYRKFGAASEVLALSSISQGEPNAGEVRVRLHFSGINPSDVKARLGARAGRGDLPFPTIIPHSDGSGVIEAVGEGVSAERIGTAVWIWNGQWRRAYGTAAQTITLPSEQAVALPDGVDMQTGAVLGIPGLTATHAVFSDGDVAGKSVLVQGGAGTVGLLAVQLARWGGAHVITTARGPGVARAEAAGAHAVVDFSAPDVADQIREANNGLPIDRIVEVEFGLNAATDAEVIAENGQICAYGSVANMAPELPFYSLMFKSVTLEMALVYLLPKPVRDAAICRLHRALTEGALTCPIAEIYPIAQCATAHQTVEAGTRSGAVLLSLPDAS